MHVPVEKGRNDNGQVTRREEEQAETAAENRRAEAAGETRQEEQVVPRRGCRRPLKVGGRGVLLALGNASGISRKGHAMGDSKGKKEKAKGQKQKEAQQAAVAQQKKDRQKPRTL